MAHNTRLAKWALVFGALGMQPRPDDRTAIEAFNVALTDATRRMDDQAILALWDDDGVSIVPPGPPLVGKNAIAAFLASVATQIKGARMQSFTMRCFDVRVSGTLASEWCVEHQVVRLADANLFDGWGRMSFVLGKGADGRWRLKQEMWSAGTPADSVLLTPRR
jgi:uncharacterized protein (TIGR02246 family)